VCHQPKLSTLLKLLLFLFFLLNTALSISQTLKGVVYDSQSIVRGVKIKNPTVVELKTIINDLKVVTITNTPTEKDFSPKEYKETLNHQIHEDLKRNPHKYYPASNTAGVDFIYLAKLIGSLFKKNNKTGPPLAKYNDFKTLFENDSYFNTKFLAEELNISEDYKFLFFEYCETKGIKKSLFDEDNAFLLTDVLLKTSDEFHEFLKKSP